MTGPGTEGSSGEIGLRDQVLRAVRSLGRPAGSSTGRAVTSDLSIDEALLLHSIGWEPVDLTCGVSVTSVPTGVWNWGQGEIVVASSAYDLAFRQAAARLARECTRAGGWGVVGVHVNVDIHPHHVDVDLVGTAVKPGGPAGARTEEGSVPFVSDLSARDFTLLQQAGWMPVGLAFGASFVYAPRRSPGTTLRQQGQNVELANFTDAIYSAREGAMGRMQTSAIAMRAHGIVGVQVTEGPMDFARHAIGFAARGTAVRLEAEAHRYVKPMVVLGLDDAVVQFDAASLRGG